jgi:hypothetical protein
LISFGLARAAFKAPIYIFQLVLLNIIWYFMFISYYTIIKKIEFDSPKFQKIQKFSSIHSKNSLKNHKKLLTICFSMETDSQKPSITLSSNRIIIYYLQKKKTFKTNYKIKFILQILETLLAIIHQSGWFSTNSSSC